MQSQVLPRTFQTTRWSLVKRANGEIDAEALQALAALCDSYWYPIYAYIRRSGHCALDAEDLTQGFFAKLLEKGTLAHADPAKGRLCQRWREILFQQVSLTLDEPTFDEITGELSELLDCV